MTLMGAGRAGHAGANTGQRSRWLARLSISVLSFGAVLFSGAWMVGGEDATADNWVGVTTVEVGTA